MPVPALAQSVSVSAPSFANRNASYTIGVTSTIPPFGTQTMQLTAGFPDVGFSQPAWTETCSAFTTCTITRSVTVFTGNTGGRNLLVTATSRIGTSTTSGSANTWVLGSSTLSPASATMQTLRTQTVTLALQTLPPFGTTFQLSLSGPAAAGSSVPATVTISSGSMSVPFTLTTGAAPGSLALSATTSSAFYTAPAAIVIQVVSPTEVPTPAGSNVSVTPPVPAGGSVPVTVTFTTVTSAGLTKLLNISPLPAPPSGHEPPGTPRYFGVSTTAVTAGPVRVCATYPAGAAADETSLRLFAMASGAWADTTSSIDTAANTVCGHVTSIAGVVFGIFRPNTAPVVGPISGPSSAIAAGVTHTFSATFTDADAADAHTGTWMWGDGTTSPATISSAGGVLTASADHAFSTSGVHTVRLVISDGANNSASPDFEVTVDASAPVVDSLTATPGSLWPPDSRMHGVTLTVSASDDTGVPVCAISSVTATAQNVKQTAYAVTGAMTVALKSFPHAVYTITVTCTDAVGRTTTKAVTVAVAKK